jgi:protein TonB
MDPEMNYERHSMDEIVFEEKNKAYGAYVHRQLYKKNLLRGLLISTGVFILAVIMPSVIRKLGLFDEAPLELLKTTTVKLEAPPSAFQPQSEASREQVQARPEEFVEFQPSDQDELTDTSKKSESEKKDLAKTDTEKTGNHSNKADSSKTGEKGDAGKSGGGKVWNKVELPPEFVGGEDAYFDFMRANMVYPEKENKAGIEGVVSVYYIVGPDGSIDHTSIHRSSGNANLDAEAVRLISMQPRYKPGRQNGLPVKVGIIVEVTFRQ